MTHLAQGARDGDIKTGHKESVPRWRARTLGRVNPGMKHVWRGGAVCCPAGEGRWVQGPVDAFRAIGSHLDHTGLVS